MSSKMKFSLGKIVYIKKLETLGFELDTYKLSVNALRIMVFGTMKSSFGVLVRLSYT